MSKSTIDAAYYWSANEATAILDYLDHLRDLIWDMYREDIIELRESEGEFETTAPVEHDENQQSLDFDDDIDF